MYIYIYIYYPVCCCVCDCGCFCFWCLLLPLLCFRFRDQVTRYPRELAGALFRSRPDPRSDETLRLLLLLLTTVPGGAQEAVTPEHPQAIPRQALTAKACLLPRGPWQALTTRAGPRPSVPLLLLLLLFLLPRGQARVVLLTPWPERSRPSGPRPRLQLGKRARESHSGGGRDGCGPCWVPT